MHDNLVMDLAVEALFVLFKVSAPILILSLVIGLLISLFQALTQIQESTLTFVPKILIIYLSFLFLIPYTQKKLTDFSLNIEREISNISSNQ